MSVARPSMHAAGVHEQGVRGGQEVEAGAPPSHRVEGGLRALQRGARQGVVGSEGRKSGVLIRCTGDTAWAALLCGSRWGARSLRSHKVAKRDLHACLWVQERMCSSVSRI